MQVVSGTTDTPFFEGKRPGFSIESRDPTGDFGLRVVRFLWVAGCLLSACQGLPPRREEAVRTDAMRREESRFPDFADDGDRSGLLAAARFSADYFRSLPPDRPVAMGPDFYSAREMADDLAYFQSVVSSGGARISDILRREFEVYSSVGSDGRGTVVFSSYYEHSLKASLKKTSRFRFPLYGRPPELDKKRGRPYFTREEIDGRRALQGRGLEIAWADDPVEIFFLQVQGSGWLLLPDGERLRVRYAGNNGHPYRSVGGDLVKRGVLSQKTFSRKAMVDYVAAHPEDRQRILNVNPRYVFFKIDRGPNAPWAYGSLNVPLIPGRSVAMDPAVFPPGVLGWMETEGANPVRRFVFNQDQGGAILGPGRVDYFAGGGEEAEKFATGFWKKGRLYFLVRKRRR